MSKNKTAGPLQSEAMKERIAVLDRRGYSQARIIEELAKPPFQLTLSQSRVSQIISEIKLRYRERADRTHAEKVQERLQQYRDVREEAWLAWERSKEDRTATKDESSMRQAMKMVGKVLTPDGSPKLELVKRIKELEGRLPVSAYLQIVVQCLDREMTLEGLNEGPITNVNLTAVDWSALSKPPERGPDPVEDRINSVGAQAAQPPHAKFPPIVQSPNGHAKR